MALSPIFIRFCFFRQVVVAPPLYRDRPNWYQAGLAQVASRFSMALSTSRPENMYLLPSFISQDLSPDGIHLTPVSGLHYMLHLFDQTEQLLSLEQQGATQWMGHVQESVRHHDDRLSYLESRHVKLQARVDIRHASSSEFDDWSTNRSEENWFTVRGLPRLGDMSSRDWQAAAQRQVKDLIRTVLRLNNVKLEYSILYVGNPVRQRTAGKTVYNVRLSSVASSQRIRDLFSGFFRKDRPVQLPRELRGVSLKNKVTLGTRIRVRILQELAKNYQASNPGTSANVRGYDPRPLLVTTPARGSADRMRTYTFVEAVTRLKVVWSDDNLAQIFQIVGDHFPGELRALFIVLNDDDRPRCLELAKNYRPPVRSSRSAPSHPATTASGVITGPGAGMDLEAGFIESLRAPPPPPPLESGRKGQDHRDRSPDVCSDPKLQHGLKRQRQPSESESSHSQKRTRRPRRSTSSSSSSSSSSHRRRHHHKKSKTKKSKKSHRTPSSSSASSSSDDRHKKSKSKSESRPRRRSSTSGSKSYDPTGSRD